MSIRATWMLAVLVAVAGVFVAYDQTPSGDPGAALSLQAPAPTMPGEAVGRALLDIARHAITSVTLNDATQRVTIEHQDGQWSNARSGQLLEALLDDLEPLRTLDAIELTDTNSLADYGLQPPPLVLTIELADRARPFVLQIGAHNPTSTAVYVRFGDDGPIYVAGALVEWKTRSALRQLGRDAGEES